MRKQKTLGKSGGRPYTNWNLGSDETLCCAPIPQVHVPIRSHLNSKYRFRHEHLNWSSEACYFCTNFLSIQSPLLTTGPGFELCFASISEILVNENPDGGDGWCYVYPSCDTKAESKGPYHLWKYLCYSVKLTKSRSCWVESTSQFENSIVFDFRRIFPYTGSRIFCNTYWHYFFPKVLLICESTCAALE